MLRIMTGDAGTTYSSAGVDIESGDRASRILYDAAKATWANREGRFGSVVSPFDDFSGFRAVDVSGLPSGSMMCLGFDGVGTKVELGERTGRYDTLAFDLFAMVCDDAIVRGGEPVVVGSILDVNTLSGDQVDCVQQMADGYVRAAKAAGVAVINGELAELGARVSGYGDFNFNWGAGLVWFARKDRLFSGFEIKAGDHLVGIEEKGFRSNGLSLVRKVFSDAHGNDWHSKRLGNSTLGELALEPSIIYSKAACELYGGFDQEPRCDVHGICHVTGGGLPGKLGRVLKPSGLGAVVDDPMQPPEIMLHCQELGGVDDREAYRTWNMGQGLVIITPDPDSVRSILDEFGMTSQTIGRVVDDRGITITSRGAMSSGDRLRFDQV